MKKIFALLLTVILLISVMPTVSFAASIPGLKVDEWCYAINDNYWINVDTGSTLTNLYFNEDGNFSTNTDGKLLQVNSVGTNGVEVYLNDIIIDYDFHFRGLASATIFLQGNNALNGGIFCEQEINSITIDGNKNGSLTIKNEIDPFDFGIFAYYNVNIKDVDNLVIYDEVDGIYSVFGNVEISNSTVNIKDKGDSSAPYCGYACGIHAGGNIVINTSDVNIVSQNAFGLWAGNGSITIDGDSEVTAYTNSTATNIYAASATEFNFTALASTNASGTDLVEFKAEDAATYKYIVTNASVPAPVIEEDNTPIPVPELVLERNGIPVIFIGEDKGEIQVKVDIDTYINEAGQFSALAPIFIENGRTYLGIRDIAEALGIAQEAIKWDDKTKTASITKSGATLEVTEGSDIIKMTYKGYIYEVPTDASAKIKDGRIYLPFRAIFELFGYEVNWDNETRTITCK